MRVYISGLYHGLFELKSGFTPYFSGFCEGMFSGFRYRSFVLPYTILSFQKLKIFVSQNASRMIQQQYV